MEQGKVPTLPLVTQRLYDMDKFEFCEVLQENIRKRFPQYGTDRDLNAFGNYLNPSCKGVHLKLVHKFEQTKALLEEKLKL